MVGDDCHGSSTAWLLYAQRTMENAPQSEPPSVSALEHAALAAWPAERVSELDGWRLRYMREVTRRANSVWPLSTTPRATEELERQVAEAEAFYEKLGASQVLFQMTPLADPGLEAVLEGQEKGTKLDGVLAAKSAFGNPSLHPVKKMKRSEFPADAKLVKGERFAAKGVNGQDVFLSHKLIKIQRTHPLC